MTEVVLAGQEAEPESKVNVEREAFEGGGMLLTGQESSGLPGVESGEVERWRPLSGEVRGLRLLAEAVPRRRLKCLADTG